MFLELSDNIILKNCFEAISTIVDEVSLECDSEGMRLRALDRSHITFVEMDLKSDLFDSYKCETPEKVNVDTDELMKVLKRCKSKDLLRLETDESNLKLTFDGDSTRLFNIRFIDISYDSPVPPKVELPVSLSLPVEVLSDFLEDMLLFDETVDFVVDEDYLKCVCDGDFGDSTVQYIHGENVNEVVKSKFNIPKIKDMLRAKKLSKVVTLELGSDMPLFLTYNISNGDGKLSFLLAPRLEAED